MLTSKIFCGILFPMSTLNDHQENKILTQVKKVDAQHPDMTIIREAAEIIRTGGLVGFPTETVYGLGADALLPEGAKRIYAAKGRPSDNPLIVHIAEFEALDKITADIPPQAKALADAFWPGPLTMIFRKSEAVPYETTGGLDTVAVRMPSHPTALALIRESGGYIAAPSANTSGRPSPTLAEHVYEDLKGKIPMILDGGAVGIGIESTIIDLSEEIPMILRPGYITKDMLAEVIGAVKDDPGFVSTDPNVHPKAPGMKYRHYAPKADLSIVEGAEEAVVSCINRLTEEAAAKGMKVGVIATDETKERYAHADVLSIGSREEEETIAHHLYEVLRDFDDDRVDVIYSEAFYTPKMGQAIMNRLLKAAGHKIINAQEEKK